ncbi:MAG: CAP domain-containing protein, partial [Eubacterium sp.]|nr:CAP domain-containing protein [Eubacterium sp.]
MKNEKSSVFMKLIVLTAFLLIGWMKPYQAYAADMVTVEITGQYDQREDSAAGARAMLTMINDFRTGRYVDGGKSTVWALAENGTVDTATYTNLGELSYDYELEKVAIQRAMELAVRFSHDRPNGEKIELLYPDKYSSMGENIAVGTGNTCNTAKKAFDAWCETTELYSGQGHRRNMLYKYFNRVGIAHVIFHYGNTEIDYWVQEFGYCTGSFGLSSTDPLNDSETISVEIDADLIQTIDIKCDKDSLEIDYGQTHDFSEASSVLRLSETWPERIGGSTYLVTVDGGYSLSSDDTSIAGITGQTITGKKAGTTKISVQSLLDSSIRKVLDLTVNPASIKDAEVKLPYSETIYSGNEQKPAPDVTLGEKTLTSGEDYEVSYENNVNAGTAKVIVTGKGNYKDNASAEFEITQKPLTNSMVIKDKGADNSYTYDGTLQQPDINVKDGDVDLVKEKDYSLSMDDSINSGDYTVTVTGTGNYTEQATASYKINPAPISSATAVLDKDALVYSGIKQAPVLTLTFNDIVLKEGDDYTLSVPDAIDCGEYTITIEGKGNFTGKTTKTFKIRQKPLSEDMIQLEKTSYTYDGTLFKPSVAVKSADSQKELEENKDYIIEKNEGGTSVGQYPVKISAKEGGNYSGQVEVSFSIVPKSLEKDMFKLENRTYNGKAGVPDITATFNGTEVTYKIVEGIGTNAGSHELTLEGTENYTGQVKADYKINPAPISSDNIKLDKKELVYNGKNQVPNPTVTFNDTVLKQGNDYEVTPDQDAVNCGKYTIGIEGTGNYTGQVTADYQINPAQISAAKADLDKEELEYTGSKQAPVLTLTFN